MSIFVRAVCTRGLGEVSAEALREGIALRLPTLATYYGEPDPETFLARLLVSDAGGARRSPGEAFSVLEGGHGEGTGAPRGEAEGGEDRLICTVVRLQKGAERDAEVAALRSALDDCDEEDVDEVLDCLGEAVEVVQVAVDLGAVEGMGWPVAIAVAATLAERGDGLIQADGEGWMAVEGTGVEQILDAD
ncbi:hypothetical protein [Chondromyces apiculatus]|uniref:Uncharacterized protein n=1 Tax=Chondromyces apiculatus DSM 436 TaxID=1192034 RepID=A0A017T7J8_9BACT|nr:hypothetical protein [Chondromyces apiculatus]EYF04785.1 Hypothetical protein CAP_3811 [Chondromyces apiculatus DSM 436]